VWGTIHPSLPTPRLLYFHGIVTVGMMERRTLLLDLNMTVESSDSSPAGVFLIGAQSRDVARLWVQLRSMAAAPPEPTSLDTQGLAPVVGLSWQEPLDDPWHYTYYWVMRGVGDTLAIASMYSLTFRSRQWDVVDGPCYDIWKVWY
jgi:hypothetical protein